MKVESRVNGKFIAALNEIAERGRQNQNMGADLSKYEEALLNDNNTVNLPPVEGALVMCTKADNQNLPVKLIKDDGRRILISELAELNSQDITLEKAFSGCKETADKRCKIRETLAERRWHELDHSKDQGKGKKTLLSEESYMICMEECGIISIVDSGQQTCSFIDELEEFQENLQIQFGFDKRTVEVIAEMYVRVQEVYWDKSQKERDWYFTRALSQMGDYNNRTVNFQDYETHVWMRGAGKVYEYNFKKEKDRSVEAQRLEAEQEYFCEKLGLEVEDYKYFRYMIRIQHFMTSNHEGKYYPDNVEGMTEEDIEVWITNLETGIGKKYNSKDGPIKEQYMEDYRAIYAEVGDKGDFSHMMYTIAANLITEGYGVQESWDNTGAPELSWQNAEERGDVAGWLGDAVYGGNGKVSFKNDDYIADLDSDNLYHRTRENGSLFDSMNQYYNQMQECSQNVEDNYEYRTKEFLRNNPYEEVEKTIIMRISRGTIDIVMEKTPYANPLMDKPEVYYGRIVTVEELQENIIYEDTIHFLEKLKKYGGLE